MKKVREKSGDTYTEQGIMKAIDMASQSIDGAQTDAPLSQLWYDTDFIPWTDQPPNAEQIPGWGQEKKPTNQDGIWNWSSWSKPQWSATLTLEDVKSLRKWAKTVPASTVSQELSELGYPQDWIERLSKTAMGLKGDLPEGITYTFDGSSVEAYLDGQEIGYITMYGEAISEVWVAPEYRRRGIATEMLNELERHLGTYIRHDWNDLSEDGRSWAYAIDPDGAEDWELSSHKTAMAERSGDPQLDSLIEEFSQGNWNGPYEQEPVSLMRTPDAAEMMCNQMSDQLTDFLAKRGIQAEVIRNTDLPSLGYENKVNPGGDDFHSVVKAIMPSGTYTIDFTASQYGYKEFPMVQKLNDSYRRRLTSTTE